MALAEVGKGGITPVTTMSCTRHQRLHWMTERMGRGLTYYDIGTDFRPTATHV